MAVNWWDIKTSFWTDINKNPPATLLLRCCTNEMNIADLNVSFWEVTLKTVLHHLYCHALPLWDSDWVSSFFQGYNKLNKHIFSRHNLLWISCSRFVDTIYIYNILIWQGWQIKNKMKQCVKQAKPSTSENRYEERECWSFINREPFFIKYRPLLETFQKIIGMRINSRTASSSSNLTKQQS